MKWAASSEPSCSASSPGIMLSYLTTQINTLRQSLSKRFFVHHERHLLDVATIISFQHVDQALHAASRHAAVGIHRQPCDPSGAAKVRIKPATIFNFWVAQWRVG